MTEIATETARLMERDARLISDALKMRYTPMAVIPGLVAPAAVWPAATGGETDPARLCAALATVAAGLLWRNTLAAVAVGVVTLVAGLQIFG